MLSGCLAGWPAGALDECITEQASPGNIMAEMLLETTGMLSVCLAGWLAGALDECTT